MFINHIIILNHISSFHTLPNIPLKTKERKIKPNPTQNKQKIKNETNTSNSIIDINNLIHIHINT